MAVHKVLTQATYRRVADIIGPRNIRKDSPPPDEQLLLCADGRSAWPCLAEGLEERWFKVTYEPELQFGDVTPHTRIRGCLLGGAVGDALGAPVEFLSLEEIRRQFGPDGIRDYAPAYGRLGAITDDTQMTLFTAEGLLRATMRMMERGICHPPSIVHHAYLRWLLTQKERPKRSIDIRTDGWLFDVRALHHRRAPGNTCLAALRDAEDWGVPAVARNTSKGCGALMRAAPVGLFREQDDILFEVAVETARLTHGHPSGSLTAGYLAV